MPAFRPKLDLLYQYRRTPLHMVPLPCGRALRTRSPSARLITISGERSQHDNQRPLPSRQMAILRLDVPDAVVAQRDIPGMPMAQCYTDAMSHKGAKGVGRVVAIVDFRRVAPRRKCAQPCRQLLRLEWTVTSIKTPHKRRPAGAHKREVRPPTWNHAVTNVSRVPWPKPKRFRHTCTSRGAGRRQAKQSKREPGAPLRSL